MRARARPVINTAKDHSAPAPRPFLKWAGGKRQLVAEILRRFPKAFHCYHEPFLGGGAVFFALRPTTACLMDVNAELITTYSVIAQRVESVIRGLSKLHYCRDKFAALRAQNPKKLTPLQRAVRMIYLNRTCFNGLYRVNSKGCFNVPFGHYKNPLICDADNLRAVAAALAPVSIRPGNVFSCEDRVMPGDLVYFDPPYYPISKTAKFKEYHRSGFGQKEHEQLAALAERLVNKGVYVVLSQSDCSFIRGLYRHFLVEQVPARRSINSAKDRRGPIAELLITPFPAAAHQAGVHAAQKTPTRSLSTLVRAS